MSKVLVTGGLGYIGAVVCRELLISGHEVVIVDNEDGELYKDRYLSGDVGAIGHKKISEMNESDWEMLGRIDRVVHLAALASVTESMTNPMKYYENNICETIALLKYMRDYGVPRITFASSCAVYSNSNPICEEDDSTNPLSPYGYTKLVCERMIQRCLPPQHSTILRLFNVIGATEHDGDRHDPGLRLVTNLLRSIDSGKPIEIRDIQAVRTYVDVLDVAKIIEMSINKPVSGIINVCNEALSNHDIIRLVYEVTGETIPIIFGCLQVGEADKVIGDCTKANIEFSMKDKWTSAEESIRNAFAWEQRRKQ